VRDGTPLLIGGGVAPHALHGEMRASHPISGSSLSGMQLCSLMAEVQHIQPSRTAQLNCPQYVAAPQQPRVLLSSQQAAQAAQAAAAHAAQVQAQVHAVHAAQAHAAQAQAAQAHHSHWLGPAQDDEQARGIRELTDQVSQLSRALQDTIRQVCAQERRLGELEQESRKNKLGNGSPYAVGSNPTAAKTGTHQSPLQTQASLVAKMTAGAHQFGQIGQTPASSPDTHLQPSPQQLASLSCGQLSVSSSNAGVDRLSDANSNGYATSNVEESPVPSHPAKLSRTGGKLDPKRRGLSPVWIAHQRQQLANARHERASLSQNGSATASPVANSVESANGTDSANGNGACDKGPGKRMLSGATNAINASTPSVVISPTSSAPSPQRHMTKRAAPAAGASLVGSPLATRTEDGDAPISSSFTNLELLAKLSVSSPASVCNSAPNVDSTAASTATAASHAGAHASVSSVGCVSGGPVPVVGGPPMGLRRSKVKQLPSLDSEGKGLADHSTSAAELPSYGWAVEEPVAIG